VCEESSLASINRSPLSMGLLTGKFTAETPIPADDVRSARPALQGERRKRLAGLDAIRDVLTRDGRTPARGALAWLWARSQKTIPIPGCRSVAQVEENVGALRRGPLSDGQMREIASRLDGLGIA
jgi:aryl-alcohol dehydrogenase-like predicted oxidoreductase